MSPDSVPAPSSSLVDNATRWERGLARRKVLPLQYDSPVTVKRDVRSFVVSTSAAEFSRAFAESMADPTRAFGLVRVMRPRQELGQPFRVGQRFQGRFSVRELLRVHSDNGRLSPVLLQRMTNWSQHSGVGRALSGALRSAEDAWTSDFGELVELALDTPPYFMRYVYLEGSYIAGHSAFSVRDVAPGRCEVEQTWLYQEIRAPYVMWVGTSVLRMHLQVVWSQIEQAAQLVQARIVETDVPSEYRDLS